MGIIEVRDQSTWDYCEQLVSSTQEGFTKAIKQLLGMISTGIRDTFLSLPKLPRPSSIDPCQLQNSLSSQSSNSWSYSRLSSGPSSRYSTFQLPINPTTFSSNSSIFTAGDASGSLLFNPLPDAHASVGFLAGQSNSHYNSRLNLYTNDSGMYLISFKKHIIYLFFQHMGLCLMVLFPILVHIPTPTLLKTKAQHQWI